MKRISSCFIVAGLVATVCGLGGCSHERFAPRHDALLDIPDNYRTQLPAQERHALGEACRSLGLPKLPDLLAQMSRENFQVREALSRIAAAEAAAEQAGAALWPSLSASAEGRRATSAPVLDIPGDVLPDQGGDIRNEYRASLSASYEVDVWNRLGSNYDAARYDAAATRYNRDALLISLGANVAETWANLLAQRALLDLFAEQLESSRAYVELTELRYGMGSASALDVSQQRQQLESLQGELALARAQRENFSAQLSSLLGSPPDGPLFPELDGLPDIPALPVRAIPFPLLEERPDVKAAFLQLRAEDERSAAALAERLPGLQLNASAFSVASQTSELFESLFWNISAGISTVLFDANALAAAQEAAESRAEAQLYVYAQTLLTALQEVASALASNRQQTALINSLQGQREEAERALSLARTRYLQGADSYLRVLTALQSLQQLQRRSVEARRQQFAYRIQLCRAVGLGPIQAEAPPTGNTEAPPS